MTDTIPRLDGAAERSPAEGATPEIPMTARGEGPAYWFFDALVVHRTPEGSTPVILELTVAPGGGPPQHMHDTLDDRYYMLSGKIAVRCGSERFLASAGDYVSLPSGVPHVFRVVGDEPSSFLHIHDDDSLLQLVRAVGRPAERHTLPPPGGEPPDFNLVRKVAAETGQPVVGPPMTSREANEILEAASAGK